MAQRIVIPGFRKIETSGGGEGGTTNYDDLTNKPSINNVPLVGKLKTVDLKLTDATLTEEGVPAEAKTVGSKLQNHTNTLNSLSESLQNAETSIDEIYKQIGDHTVKSDVPENAVFTDTVYDDAEVKEDLTTLKKETTVNLLNPTLQTTTSNGVTCTNNGDGTYTLNGTSTNPTYFLLSSQTFDLSKTYKIVGCPKDGIDKYSIYDDKNTITGTGDKGNGGEPYSPSVNPKLYISIQPNIELNNLIFKPMFTTNLDATYDDFVQYTGDTGKLNSDVASLLKRIETLESLVNKTDTTVTE